MGVKLDELVGEHFLSGVDFVTIPLSEEDFYGTGPLNAMRFVLDGLMYVAIEDPDDGYRSYLREIRVEQHLSSMTNRFVPVRVIGVLDEGISGSECEYDDYEPQNVLHLYVLKDGGVRSREPVISVGTNNTDQYYPYCVSRFDPRVLGEVKNEQ